MAMNAREVKATLPPGAMMKVAGSEALPQCRASGNNGLERGGRRAEREVAKLKPHVLL